MIGRDYHAWGSKRQITHRFGDNQGNPFPGPIKFSFIDDKRLLVQGKSGVLFIQNLVGAIEAQITPFRKQQSVRFSTPKLGSETHRSNSSSSFADMISRGQDGDEDDDWEMKMLMQETNETAQSRFPIRHAQIEGQTLASCTIPYANTAVIVDDRCRIKLYDLQTFSVTKSFGELGEQPGAMLRPTAIACARLDTHTSLIIIGDSAEGQQQRISIFTSEGDLVCVFGEEGPLEGQFRDICCIAVKPTAGSSTVTSSEDRFRCEYPPSWFRPDLSGDALEDELYASEDNNFIVGSRVSHMTSTTTTENTNNNMYDLMYVSSAEKNIVRLHLKYQSLQEIDQILQEGNVSLTMAERVPGFYITNRMGEKLIYPCLLDLLRQNPYLRDIRVREESRDSLFFAVVDRKNYRIQLCRHFWTKTLLFSPSAEVVEVLGGLHQRHVDLLDPVSVAFAPGGEIAVCDLGRHAVMLLSPSYQLIKLVKLTFESIRDLKEAGALATRRRAEQEERERIQLQSASSRMTSAAAGGSAGGSRRSGSRRASSRPSTDMDEILAMTAFPGTVNAGATGAGASTASSAASVSSGSSAFSSLFHPDSQVSVGDGGKSTAGHSHAGSSSAVTVRKPLAVTGNNNLASSASITASVTTEGTSITGRSDKKKSCWIVFGADNSVVIGFYSGGLYILSPNRKLPVGDFEQLELSVLGRIFAEYCNFEDIAAVRNTCRFLHDFTREMRYNYRLLPIPRRWYLRRLLFLFTRWARMQADGADSLKNHVFLDAYHRVICPQHLQGCCPFVEYDQSTHQVECPKLYAKPPRKEPLPPRAPSPTAAAGKNKATGASGVQAGGASPPRTPTAGNTARTSASSPQHMHTNMQNTARPASPNHSPRHSINQSQHQQKQLNLMQTQQSAAASPRHTTARLNRDDSFSTWATGASPTHHGAHHPGGHHGQTQSTPQTPQPYISTTASSSPRRHFFPPDNNINNHNNSNNNHNNNNSNNKPGSPSRQPSFVSEIKTARTNTARDSATARTNTARSTSDNDHTNTNNMKSSSSRASFARTKKKPPKSLSQACPYSHDEIVYDRAELVQTGAYMLYEDFLFFISEAFGPKFLYTYEPHIQALFQTYSHQLPVYFARHDHMDRENSAVRERILVTDMPALSFASLLELFLVFEEDIAGYKPLLHHKLFKRPTRRLQQELDKYEQKKRMHVSQLVPSNFESMEDPTAYVDPLEQYNHGVNVSPVKRNLGRHIITRPGFQEKVRPLLDPTSKAEHVAVVQHTTERAVDLMKRLFS